MVSRERLNFKGIKFNIWYYFLLFVLLLIIIIWVFQVAFLKPLYQQSKRKELRETTEEIRASYSADTRDVFIEKARDLGGEKNLEIVVLDVPSGNALYFYVMTPGGEEKQLPKQFYETQTQMQDEAVSEINLMQTAGQSEINLLIYARADVVNGRNTLFYVSTPIASIDMAVGVLKNQLLFVTLIALIVAFLISWYLSERISTPIESMSKNAKKLAKGDYDIHFKGNGYREIDELAEALNYAKDELSKTDQLRKELIANISHDIRTPLTMVKAYAEMIRDLSGDNKLKRDQHTQIIIDEADRLTKLVSDMLDLSKLESGANELNIGEFDLSDLVRAVCNRFRLAKELEGFVIEEHVQDGIRIRADEIKIEQVVYNLTTNAINYTGDNKTVTVNLTLDKDVARFEVVDSGKGIPNEELKGIWERYYRASRTHKRPVKGSGLGLSIVRTILEAHHAKYGVNSTLGEGSCFYFEIRQNLGGEKTEKADRKSAENYSKRDKSVL